MTGAEVARRLRLSEWTLRQWRRNGRGPAYIRVGRLVRYRAADVEAYLAQREVRSAHLGAYGRGHRTGVA